MPTERIAATPRSFGMLDHARYGALGLPLAFVALPLYVVLPAHYGATLGVPLAALGAVLLGSRLLDALVDPLLGRWADQWLGRSTPANPHAAWRVMMGCALLLMAGFWALFFPTAFLKAQSTTGLLWWCGVTVTVTCLAYSACTIAHQAWGSRLGGDVSARARWVAWREGLALVGVLCANTVAAVWGVAALSASLSVTLALAMWALWHAPAPFASDAAASGAQAPGPRLLPTVSMRPAWAEPWRHPEFRRLLAVYMLNGVAAAVPATLVLFFIRDVVQRADLSGLFLGAYFLMGALGVPLWVRLIGRWGPSRAWAAGMAGHVLAFGGVMLVGPGDVALYAGVCLLSGLMLGADLTAPGTLLTGVMQRAQNPAGLGASASGREGVFTGWWQLATKLNLALAAGLALPLLDALGYVPSTVGSGPPGAQAMASLAWVYGLLPCVFKALALCVWWLVWWRPGAQHGLE